MKFHIKESGPIHQVISKDTLQKSDIKTDTDFQVEEGKNHLNYRLLRRSGKYFQKTKIDTPEGLILAVSKDSPVDAFAFSASGRRKGFSIKQTGQVVTQWTISGIESQADLAVGKTKDGQDVYQGSTVLKKGQEIAISPGPYSYGEIVILVEK